MSDYHLLFASEYHYLPYIFTTCQSILDTLEFTADDANDHITFHVIIDDSVPSRQIQTISKVFSEQNQRSKVSFGFELHRANPDIFEGYELLYRGNWSTKSNYYRLLLARMISPDIKRILYLDIDIMLCDDVRKMFKHFPMGQEVLYAVSTPYALSISKNVFAQDPIHELPSRIPGFAALNIPIRSYFNSGVMLINMEQWVNQNIEGHCLDVGNDWILPMHDQDILNFACQGKVTYMGWDWNMCSDMLNLSVTGGLTCNDMKLSLNRLPLHSSAPKADTLPSLVEKPHLIHFTKDKPWDPKSVMNFTLRNRSEIQARLSQHQRWGEIFRRLSPVFRRAKQLYQNL